MMQQCNRLCLCKYIYLHGMCQCVALYTPIMAAPSPGQAATETLSQNARIHISVLSTQMEVFT